ncbi:S-adenosyl-L-methionine-dependent methyltransferase [Mycena amicta]|nr:S-adenosyl-L-methionine-dependent methyltransferase [Mycena amicta]
MAHSEHHIANALRGAYPFNDEFTSVLDFACGKGLISRGLAPYCKRIVAVDHNPVSVQLFAERIRNQGIPSEEMRVVCTELKGNDTELDGEKFDVVVCSAAYHHLESINDTTRTLAYFLKPTGCLLVVDFLTTDVPITEDVPHKFGFSEEQIRAAFDGARLQVFDFKRLSTAKFHGQTVVLFLAKGTKHDESAG